MRDKMILLNEMHLPGHEERELVLRIKECLIKRNIESKNKEVPDLPVFILCSLHLALSHLMG